MKALRGLVIAALTAGVLGACSSGGHAVVATDTAVRSTAAPAYPNNPSTHPPTDLVMPDLRGMYWTDAEQALRTLGWTGVLSKAPNLPNAPYRKNQIASQTPSPGQVIANDAVITLQFVP